MTKILNYKRVNLHHKLDPYKQSSPVQLDLSFCSQFSLVNSSPL